MTWGRAIPRSASVLTHRLQERPDAPNLKRWCAIQTPVSVPIPTAMATTELSASISPSSASRGRSACKGRSSCLRGVHHSQGATPAATLRRRAQTCTPAARCQDGWRATDSRSPTATRARYSPRSTSRSRRWTFKQTYPLPMTRVWCNSPTLNYQMRSRAPRTPIARPDRVCRPLRH